MACNKFTNSQSRAREKFAKILPAASQTLSLKSRPKACQKSAKAHRKPAKSPQKARQRLSKGSLKDRQRLAKSPPEACQKPTSGLACYGFVKSPPIARQSNAKSSPKAYQRPAKGYH